MTTNLAKRGPNLARGRRKRGDIYFRIEQWYQDQLKNIDQLAEKIFNERKEK